MTKILLHGACGRMGHWIADTVSGERDCKIVAGVDPSGEAYGEFPVYPSLAEVKETADVIIDFSSATAVDALLAYAAERKLPLVLWVLRSSNMSIGVNLLIKVLREAAPVLAAAGFDMEIVEKHHNQKLDAPSGTALSLADACSEACGGGYDYVYDRSQRREKRPEREIGISSVRGGTIVGDHDVI